MKRSKAAAVHLLISATIGMIAAGLIFGLWYARPYGQASGAGRLIGILLGVDVVLGPLLTFIIYRQGKKGLGFDLCFISVVQASAFIYGMFVIMQARPAFIVAVVDRFSLVAANELAADDLAKAAKPEFRTRSWTGPLVVGAELPTDIGLRNELVFSGATGKDIEKYPRYYVDYETVATSMLKRARTLNAFESAHPASTPIIDRWLSEHHRAQTDVVWLPLTARRTASTMLLDRISGQPLDTLSIDPW